MADIDNVVVIRFAESSKAYQAMNVLKECAADGRIELTAAAIVERTPEGELQIPEKTDDAAFVGTASGSLIGMLVGVLGGPLGVLLGWGTGAMLGEMYDIDRVEEADEALFVLGRAVPAGSTALVASVREPAVEVIDGEMAKLGGEVTRRPTSEVEAEVAAASEAAEAAAQEAYRVMRLKKQAELSTSVDEHIGKVREKLHAPSKG